MLERVPRAIRPRRRSALLIIAPRQPERFDEVERLARGEGFAIVRRTELPIDAEPRADVVVLDTIGELAQLYQIATVVFVGGSLVDDGGHNILEPAVFGKPIVFGPHMHELRARLPSAFLAQRRRRAGAVRRASSRRRSSSCSADPVRRARLGAAARALVEANRGAKRRDARRRSRELLPTGRPAHRPALPRGALSA